MRINVERENARHLPGVRLHDAIEATDELASLGPGTVSMMSTVVPDDPAVRTFKVVRKPADGLAYASALADKYGLDSVSLRRRLAR